MMIQQQRRIINATRAEATAQLLTDESGNALKALEEEALDLEPEDTERLSDEESDAYNTRMASLWEKALLSRVSQQARNATTIQDVAQQARTQAQSMQGIQRLTSGAGNTVGSTSETLSQQIAEKVEDRPLMKGDNPVAHHPQVREANCKLVSMIRDMAMPYFLRRTIEAHDHTGEPILKLGGLQQDVVLVPASPEEIEFQEQLAADVSTR